MLKMKAVILVSITLTLMLIARSGKFYFSFIHSLNAKDFDFDTQDSNYSLFADAVNFFETFNHLILILSLYVY